MWRLQYEGAFVYLMILYLIELPLKLVNMYFTYKLQAFVPASGAVGGGGGGGGGAFCCASLFCLFWGGSETIAVFFFFVFFCRCR